MVTLKSHTDKISETGRFCATFLTGTEPPQHLGAAGSSLFCPQVVWGGELDAAEGKDCPGKGGVSLGFHEGVTFPID